MKHKFQILRITFIIAISISCSPTKYSAITVDHKPPVDTRSKEIFYQNKTTYTFNEGTITFDNLFDGARLNSCTQENDSTFNISIEPENVPINSSPWYAFRIVSNTHPSIIINIRYKQAKHRYNPKFSVNGIHWNSINKKDFATAPDTMGITIRYNISTDTTWISSQEIENSERVISYWKGKEGNEAVSFNLVGETELGRPLVMLDLYRGKKKGKPIIVIFSRQHPPEVTGYYAMKAFVDRLIQHDELTTNFLNKYRVLVFPLINPDGVDLGHWRFNTGGVDLNRDWGIYHQPEVRIIADRIVYESKRNKSDIILGIDFHSTYQDIYYTNIVDRETLIIGNFKNMWLRSISESVPGKITNEEPSEPFPSLTSKNWFYNQFHAEGITYEIGDNTPRDFIKKKGEISALLMMELLLK